MNQLEVKSTNNVGGKKQNKTVTIHRAALGNTKFIIIIEIIIAS